MEEFFRQGDLERSLNLPISFLCDRTTIVIPQAQKGMYCMCLSTVCNIKKLTYYVRSTAVPVSVDEPYVSQTTPVFASVRFLNYARICSRM